MDSTQSISIGMAFAHCASTSSYWWGIVIVIAFLIAGWIVIEKFIAKSQDPSNAEKVWMVVCLFAIGVAVFMRPCEVAVNTSIEMAARGHYLGY